MRVAIVSGVRHRCPDQGKIVSYGDYRARSSALAPSNPAGDSRRVLAPPADLGRLLLDKFFV